MFSSNNLGKARAAYAVRTQDNASTSLDALSSEMGFSFRSAFRTRAPGMGSSQWKEGFVKQRNSISLTIWTTLTTSEVLFDFLALIVRERYPDDYTYNLPLRTFPSKLISILWISERAFVFERLQFPFSPSIFTHFRVWVFCLLKDVGPSLWRLSVTKSVPTFIGHGEGSILAHVCDVMPIWSEKIKRSIDAIPLR